MRYSPATPRLCVAARPLQVAVLVLELAALPALAFKGTRVAVGVGLIAFHLGQQILLGRAFHANTALLALLYLPVDEWCPRGCGDERDDSVLTHAAHGRSS